MQLRRILLSGLLLISTFLLSGVELASAADPVGHVFPALDSSASIPSYSQTASRNGYVILQAWETEKLHALKAANPAVKVLVYKNLAFSAELPSTHNGPSPSGVLYSEAPESWFLKDTSSGQPFTSSGFEWLWAMDIGLPEYQKRWADNVIAELNSQGWDGVFIDDANATMKYHHDVDQVAKYPSDASYSAAMGSALAYIGPKIHAAGKLAIPNFAAWVEAPATYNSWLQYVDGALDEMFVKWGKETGQGYRTEAQWTSQLAEAKFAAAKGKAFIACTQGSPGETQAARLGYATVLLASTGDSSYAFTPEYATEEWMPEYNYDLGAPLGEESRDSNGVHRRLFEKGIVLVNPTTSSRSVSFNGTYSGSGLSEAGRATMAAHSALVMTGTAKPDRGSGRIDVSTDVGARGVRLTWVSARSSVKSYRVLRNGHAVARTRRRHEADHGLRSGRLYRYRVVGLDRAGHIVASSPTLRVRPGVAASGLAQAVRAS